MSHSPAAQAVHGTGSGRRTIPTTRSPGSRPLRCGASTTTPSDSWPRINRSWPGGAEPYSPARMSRSVPQTPSASVLTSTAPSAGGGSATSWTFAEPAAPGVVVNASMAIAQFPHGLHKRARCLNAGHVEPFRTSDRYYCGLNVQLRRPCRVEDGPGTIKGGPSYGFDRTQTLGHCGGPHSLAKLILRPGVDLARDRVHLECRQS